MLKIRLKRVGRKHDPSFRLVVLESQRGPKSGDYIENLGSYNARTDEKTINGERVNHWISVGAKPSDTAHNLLVELGIITGKKVNVLPKKSPLVKEGEGEKAEAPASVKKAEAPTVETATEADSRAPSQAEAKVEA
ncbi:MAG: 30S ribosomal protein S16 [Candidatus Paceibacterota bacterium]